MVSWSGGKDSCLALHALRSAGGRDIAALITTVTLASGEVAMHGVSRELIGRQAAALGLRVDVVELPAGASNRVYEEVMSAHLLPLAREGVSTMAFGDLFLEEIRGYRERLMHRIGIRPIFPLWARDTRALVDEFIGLGFRAIVVAVDPARLDPSFAGRQIDARFVADLPDDVDPCGENGEFHSFVFDGPGFGAPVSIELGDRHLHEGLCYQRIMPA